MSDNNARGTLINQVGAVFAPVADQDRALGFYLDTLGFEKRADFTYGEDSRWMEVAPPGAANTIALVPLTEGEPAGGEVTRCAFATDDIEADHADLRARGVDAEIAHTGKHRPGPQEIRSRSSSARFKGDLRRLPLFVNRSALVTAWRARG